MTTFLRKANRWLLPAVLILFILQVLTFPFVLGLTYADRSETPDHTLTYNPFNLYWDKDTEVDKDGVAQLDLFDAIYEGVASADGENVVAPGTEGFNIVRLKNNAPGPIYYTAVLYRIRSSEELPVEAALKGENFKDTDRYSLPEGVEEEHVIRAVSGQVHSGRIQDFDIDWMWEFERLDEQSVLQDELDTYLGDLAASGEADEVTVGLYIVVEDYNDYSDDDDNDGERKKKPVVVLPSPDTSDGSHVEMYLMLMLISAVLLVLLYIDRRKEKEKQCEE